MKPVHKSSRSDANDFSRALKRTENVGIESRFRAGDD
jgi:hypothetical protein